MNKKGSVGPVAFVIFIVLLVGVSIPITTDLIANASLTGLTATVVSFIPVMLGVAGLVGAASMSGSR